MPCSEKATKKLPANIGGTDLSETPQVLFQKEKVPSITFQKKFPCSKWRSEICFELVWEKELHEHKHDKHAGVGVPPNRDKC